MDAPIEPTISNNVRSNNNNNNSNGGTVFSSILSLSNTIIGTGILSLPYTMANTGVFGGILLFIITAYISKSSLCLFIDIANIIAPNRNDLKISQLSEMINMPKLGIFINSVIALNGFGMATSLLIASSDFVLSLFKNFLSVDYTGFLVDKRFWITMEFLVIIPLVFKKTLASLKMFSLFSLFSITYLTSSIILKYFTLGGNNKPPKGLQNTESGEPTINLKTEILKKFMGVSIIIFAYGCQQNIFPIYSELRPSLKIYMPKVIINAIAFCTVIYVLVGYCGYATFGKDVESNILNNYDDSDLFIVVARSAMAIYCTLTYAVQMHPCRESIKKEYINYKIRHQKDYGDINENEPEEKSKLLADAEQNENYGSTSGVDLPSPSKSKSNSSSNNSSRQLSYDDVEDEEDEFESQIDANDADDERSSDSHHVKHVNINIDILDSMPSPVNSNLSTIKNYDTEDLFYWLTVILLCTSYILAMLVNDFGKLLSLLGATSCTTLTFILPGYLYVKITRGVNIRRIQSYILIILGVIIGIIGTIAALYI